MRLLPVVLLASACSKPAPTPQPEPTRIVVVVPPPRTVCFDAEPAYDTPRLVLSHPFNADGGPSTRFAVYDTHTLQSGAEFHLGRATEAVIRFTPDGQLGAVAQTDGTVGVFRLRPDGRVTVIDPGFGEGELYAHDVVWDTDNKRLLVLDANWANNGGGVYEVRLDCDTGALDRPRRLVASRQASGLVLRDDDALLVATNLEGTEVLTDVHAVTLDRGRVQWSARQLDDRAMRSAVTPIGRDWLAVADNSAFSGMPHRLAFSRLDDEGIASTQVLEVEDPFDVAASPFHNAVLVSSGIRNALVPVSLSEEEWTAGSPVARPRLPGRMVVVQQGDAKGRVYLAENSGVRRLQFRPDGTIEDLGATEVGSGQAAIIGSIGVQP